MSDEIINIIEPLLEDGQILMDVTHDVRGNFVRIIVDSESVLTLDDTAKLTRSIKNALTAGRASRPEANAGITRRPLASSAAITAS